MKQTFQEKITVVIPIYNTEEYLPQCLESVINQTYKNLEILCINNNSTDNCVSILNYYLKLDTRIKVYNNHSHDIGSTRNIGIKKATGDYLGFVDSDDYIDKEMFEKAYLKIKEQDSDICFWGYYKTDEYAKDIDSSFHGAPSNIDDNFNMFTIKDNNILLVTNPAPWNKLFKMSFIKKNHIFFPRLSIGEDLYFTFLAFILAKSITFMADGLYYYRIREHSTMRQIYRDPFSFCKPLLMLKQQIIELGFKDLLKNSYEKLAESVSNTCFANIKHYTSEEEYLSIISEYNSKYKDKLKL